MSNKCVSYVNKETGDIDEEDELLVDFYLLSPIYYISGRSDCSALAL